MSIRTVISIYDEEGFESDRIRSDYASANYDSRNKQQMTLSASASKVEIELGAVATLQYLFITTDADITVYLDTDTVTVTVDALLLVTGCSHTKLEIVAEDGAALIIYMAGS